MSRVEKAQSEPPRLRRITKRGAVDSQVGRPLQIAEIRSRGMDTGLKGNAELVDPGKPLTDMQKAFVMYMAQGESVVSAMSRAGYDTNTGSTYGYRLIRQPNVLALLSQEKAKYEASCQMTRKRVMDGLLEGVEMAKLAGEPASIIAGWREIGKMCGYYEPVTRKVDITVSGGLVLDRMNRLSDAELLRLIQEDVSTVLEIEDES